MARSPNENAIKAKVLYKKGMSLVDIANKLNVPAGSVRRWKSKQKWDDEIGERSEKNAKASEKKASACKVRTMKPENVAKKQRESREMESVYETMYNDKLTEKQKLFCLYYVQYRNKLKAYQKAYQCTYNTAACSAYKLYKKPEIREEIERLLADYRSNIEIDTQDLIQWYLDIARADMNDFITIESDGTVTIKNNVNGLLISEVSESGNGIKFKLNDRMRAMEWLGNHIGLANEEQKARIEALKSKNNVNINITENKELTELLSQRSLRRKVNEEDD